MSYKTIVGSLIVLPAGQPIFSEQATAVSLQDEAAGMFVEVAQHGRADVGKIQINPDEWPELCKAIDCMMETIAEHEQAEGQK